MAIELPSMPKFLVINISLIAAILLSALIGMIMFWQFTGIFLNQPEQVGQPKINVNISYNKTAIIGTTWIINGTAENIGNDALHNITIIIQSDGNIESDEFSIPIITAGEKIMFQLRPRVKDAAAIGIATAQLSVTIPDTVLKKDWFEYSISTNLNQ